MSKDEEKKPDTHDELKGFEIKVDEFGNIISNIPVQKLNQFLDEHVDDKKLRDRDDQKSSKK